VTRSPQSPAPSRDALSGARDGAPIYLFDAGEEERRLIAQARLFDPLTERLFRTAGLASGMRVLDLGSGVGDTAMLAARIVGPSGSVLGVDISAERLGVARSRATAAGLRQLRFVAADVVEGLPDDEPEFDAVIGRLVLMYLRDPVRALRAAAARLRPGGLVCFQEVDATFDPCHPPSPVWGQAQEWFLETAARAGVELRMGVRLHPTFLAAGLPAPELRLEAAIGGGERAPAFAWADVFCSMAPLMERLGVATAAEVEPGTLGERLQDEVTARDGVVIAPLLIGAWARAHDRASAGRSADS
jgi:SAM-dependent methyltransferase